MWTLESARDDYLKNKKQKHCSNCKFSGLTKSSGLTRFSALTEGELMLCCKVKMEIIEFFPSLNAKFCKYYTEK